ncbi:hypothetical protein K503DRAFT_626287 [Rhizopogon vinicolor AM-OR11-026]|uniref:Secreted protein n=1 Tax=Rhizopogon vinicolor AM-OR11-026 TaxID=1314800 RepID=A0A1B7MI18_9AGAM|nr:hypothetical protein K503DRAFT_626287 [Rhizopogon vinicolor AM-OR11-026]
MPLLIFQLFFQLFLLFLLISGGQLINAHCSKFKSEISRTAEKSRGTKKSCKSRHGNNGSLEWGGQI